VHQPARIGMPHPLPSLLHPPQTNSITPGPAVVHIKPEHDDVGDVTTPARVHLRLVAANQSTLATAAPAPGWAVIPIAVSDAAAVAALVGGMAVGDTIRITTRHDATDKGHKLTVTAVGDGWVNCSALSSSWVQEGDAVQYRAAGTHKVWTPMGRVAALPQLPGAIWLSTGDRLRVELGDHAGHPAVLPDWRGEDAVKQRGQDAMISTSLARVFEDVR